MKVHLISLESFLFCCKMIVAVWCLFIFEIIISQMILLHYNKICLFALYSHIIKQIIILFVITSDHIFTILLYTKSLL